MKNHHIFFGLCIIFMLCLYFGVRVEPMSCEGNCMYLNQKECEVCESCHFCKSGNRCLHKLQECL
jgi:hypothetical protein